MWAAYSWWKLKITLLGTFQKDDWLDCRWIQQPQHAGSLNLTPFMCRELTKNPEAFRARVHRCLSTAWRRASPVSLTPFVWNIYKKQNTHTHTHSWFCLKIHTDLFLFFLFNWNTRSVFFIFFFFWWNVNKQLQTYEPLGSALISCFRTLAALKATVSCVGFTLSSVQKVHRLTL